MLKCYEYEYNIGNCPDTNLLFVWAKSAKEAADTLSNYGDPVSMDDLYEIDPQSRYFSIWAHTYGRKCNVYQAKDGVLVKASAYNKRRFNPNRLIGV